MKSATTSQEEEKTTQCEILPQIRPISGAGVHLPGIAHLIEDVQKHLTTILPEDIFASYSPNEDEIVFEQRMHHLNSYLPYIHWEKDSENEGCLAVYIIGRRNLRFSPEDFAKKMLTHWLVPDKILHILAQRQLDFFFDRYAEGQYFFLEFYLELGKVQDKIYALQNMPNMLHELRKGFISSYDAFNILNTKGIASEEKDMLIVNEIRAALQKKPQEFDRNMLHEIQQLLGQCPAEFKQVREVTHLARVVTSHYLFRRTLLRLINKNPRKRHVCLKILRSKLHFPFGQKNVLGFVIGINSLNVNREVLEERHITEAVQNIIPEAYKVKGAFLSFHSNFGPIRTMYFEVVKGDNSSFSLEEVKQLRIHLPTEIKHHVEHLMPITFMRRNEEEVYRNIITLREQIQYIKDIPQVMISFEEQTGKDLYFTVVLLRVLQNDREPSVEELFKEVNPGSVFIPDRRECVGYVRKKYPKEANVFRVLIPKADFLRKDRSVDLYKARHFVTILLTNALGRIRDYNGGLMLKQDERLKDFTEQLPHEDSFLLENFFYSITPIAMQGVLNPRVLKKFYQAFRRVHTREIGSEDTYLMENVVEKDFVVCMFRSDDSSLQGVITEAFSQFENSSLEWASSSMNVHGTFCFGFVLQTSNKSIQSAFIEALEEKAKAWLQEVNNRQILRINLACKARSLDPRVTRSDNSAIIVKMLYEGLTRMGKDRKPYPAIAKKIDVSDDGKKYTFHLRNSMWTDKSPITAYDFEYSWKKVLETSRDSLYTYTFSVIKNAKDIFKKKKHPDEAGIHAIDDKTLVVELEHPVPYFLEFTSHWTYLLINSKVDRTHAGWAYHDGDTYVCNGPFKLKEWKQNREIVVEKNPDYWDAENVKLEQVIVSMVDNPFTELRMFENDEIDFTGMASASLPLSRVRSKKGEGELQTYPTAGVYGLWVNTQRFPFNNKNFRKALSLAVDRRGIQKHLLFDEKVTSSILPNSLSSFEYNVERECDIAEARRHFDLALQELEISRKELPIIHLSYSTRRRKTVCELAQKNWQEVFGLEVRVDEYDWGTLYNNVVNDRHQLAGLTWYSWFWDPNYILSCFSSWVSDKHITKWQNKEYSELVQASSVCLDENKRATYLKKAEEILMDEVPVIPLHQCSTFFLKKPYVKGVYSSELMEIDFKWAYIERGEDETCGS